jgi:hypothetical protein
VSTCAEHLAAERLECGGCLVIDRLVPHDGIEAGGASPSLNGQLLPDGRGRRPSPLMSPA